MSREIDLVARRIFDVPLPLSDAVLSATEMEWNVDLPQSVRHQLQRYFLKYAEAYHTSTSAHRPARGRPRKVGLQHDVAVLWAACKEAGGSPSVAWQSSANHAVSPFVRGAAIVLGSLLREDPTALHARIVHAGREIRTLFPPNKQGRPRKTIIHPV